MIKGCYIPFNWKEDIEEKYLKEIKYYCLIMTENYIKNNFYQIKKYSNVIEKRIDDSWCTLDMLLNDNKINFEMCKKYNYPYVIIDENYEVNINL